MHSPLRLSLLFSLLCALFLSFPAVSASLPASIDMEGQAVQLNGEGLRKKLFIKLYRAGLYLVAPSQSGESVMAADEPMAIDLKIISSLITQEKMVAAIEDGFALNPANNTAEMQQQIKKFIAVFGSGVAEGDHFSFRYAPGKGTVVLKQGKILETIQGLQFKSALFGIWLSDKPVQESLKKAMLTSD